MLAGLLVAALLGCVVGKTGVQVQTAEELRKALADGIQHIVITSHLNLITLSSNADQQNGFYSLPLQAAVSTATIRVCPGCSLFPSAELLQASTKAFKHARCRDGALKP